MALRSSIVTIIKKVFPDSVWQKLWKLRRYHQADRFAATAGCSATERKHARSVFRALSADCPLPEDHHYRYGQLEKYIDRLSPEETVKTLSNLFRHNCERLQNKGQIKVAFFVYSSAEWQYDPIYRSMEEDPQFEPWIVICGYQHGTKESIAAAYEKTVSFFQTGDNYRIHTVGYHTAVSSEPLLDQYDVLFYCMPGSVHLPSAINIENRLLSQLAVFMFYGYQLTDLSVSWTHTNYFDLPLMKMCWKHFCGSQSELQLFTSSPLKGFNAELSGFPKVDVLVDNQLTVRKDLWKTSEKTRCKIVWAPHFNMLDGMNGTFHENYRWFLQYAKDHPEISWIVRPHPRMEWGVLQKKLFSSAEEYHQYLADWDTLPNARVIPDGEYYDIFATSDAMILDSVSFTAEYQYTGNPMLILLPEHPRQMSQLGNAIVSASYCVRGNDHSGIESFIRRDIPEDSRKILRKDMFHDHMDTRRITGLSATEYIMHTIKTELSAPIHPD